MCIQHVHAHEPLELHVNFKIKSYWLLSFICYNIEMQRRRLCVQEPGGKQERRSSSYSLTCAFVRLSGENIPAQKHEAEFRPRENRDITA